MIILLEAVALIGRTLDDGGDPLADFIQPAPRNPKVETPYLVKLDFRTESDRVRLVSSLEEIDQGTLRRYLWVGNAVGNRPQQYLTTNDPKYLVGPAPANLLAALAASELVGSVFQQNLERLVSKFYQDLPDGSPVLDVSRLGLAPDGFVASTWDSSVGKPREKAKKVVEAVTELVLKHVLDELGLKKPEASLWTVCLNGESLAADPSYGDFVRRAKEGTSAKPGKKAAVGTCTICGAVGRPVLQDFAQLDFLKYYITDKIGAASGVSPDGFGRSFVACADCFRGLALAEKYVRQHLSLGVGPLSFLVLPAFLYDPALSRSELDGWAGKLKDRVKVLASISGWLNSLGGERGLEAELADFLEEMPHENTVLLNFLFYHKPAGRSEFRILGLVKDVAPSRITHMIKHSHRLANRAERILGADQRWWLDLSQIWKLIPLNEGARGKEYKKLLYIYNGLLVGKPLNYSFLVNQFVAMIKVYHTGRFNSTNIKPAAGYEEADMCRRILQANLFLKLLREENLLRGGMRLKAPLATEGHLLPEEMRTYLVEMAYDAPQTALFLLGCLLHQVGRAQAGNGYEQKPVLDKVNYNGMLWPKVVRLSNLLVDQLRQHGILRYNEGLFATMKQLLDAHRADWRLSPEENVFYILSGYAYATRIAMKTWAEKKNASEGDNDQ